MEFLISNAELLQTLTNLTQLFGVPIAIVLFVLAKRKEIQDRENGTYDALDAKYQEYLATCLQNSDIPLFDSGLVDATNLSSEQQHRLQIAYCMLISILERAYLMYRDQRTEIRRKQWSGWEAYMEDYLSHPAFVTYWDSLGQQFDGDFVDHMNRLKSRIQKSQAVQFGAVSSN